MPVASVPALSRVVESGIPARRRRQRSAVIDAPPHRSGADRRPAHSNMQKSLTQMNLQIHHVISEITGVTGLAIVDAILAGERDPAVLAKLRDHRIHASEEIVQKSLVGNWRPEHLFTLKQSRQIYQQYQDSITACDEEIERLVIAFEPRVDPSEHPLPPDRKAKQRKRKKRGVTPGVNPKTGFDTRT